MDVGSTTSDLVILHQGKAEASAFSDAERMRIEELLYTGVVRTPVMAVVHQVPFDGVWQGVAAEHFATTADVYRLTGDLPDGYDMAETADGAGKSLKDCARRLARMVGRDLSDAGMSQWRILARSIKSAQLRTLQKAVERALSRGLLHENAPFLGAGAGRFLVRELSRHMGREYRDVSEWVSAESSVADWAVTCLPAYAVARLAVEGRAWRR
jgi:probable H4MPT-linked C1 transfer pathway protein